MPKIESMHFALSSVQNKIIPLYEATECRHGLCPAPRTQYSASVQLCGISQYFNVSLEETCTFREVPRVPFGVVTTGDGNVVISTPPGTALDILTNCGKLAVGPEKIFKITRTSSFHIPSGCKITLSNTGIVIHGEVTVSALAKEISLTSVFNLHLKKYDKYPTRVRPMKHVTLINELDQTLQEHEIALVTIISIIAAVATVTLMCICCVARKGRRYVWDLKYQLLHLIVARTPTPHQQERSHDRRRAKMLKDEANPKEREEKIAGLRRYRERLKVESVKEQCEAQSYIEGSSLFHKAYELDRIRLDRDQARNKTELNLQPRQKRKSKSESEEIELASLQGAGRRSPAPPSSNSGSDLEPTDNENYRTEETEYSRGVSFKATPRLSLLK